MQTNQLEVSEVLTGIQVAVRAAGSQKKFGQSLGVTQQAVGHWMRKGYVPAHWVVPIETLYGIPRSKLINPKIADLVAAPGDVL